MTKQKLSPLNVFFIAGAVVLTAMFGILALHTYFADSEIWLLTMSQSTFQPSHHNSIYYKWSFHLVTYLFSYFAPNELAVYLWSRTGWAIVALITLLMTARLFTKVYKDKALFWPLFAVMISSSVFINQAFRIRGDIFCLFLHICYLTVFYRMANTKLSRRHFWLLCLINGAMALSTPKFLIFVICQIVLCFVWAVESPKKKRLIWDLVASHALAPLIICSVTLAAAFFANYSNFLLSISSAGDFYLKSFKPELFNVELFSLLDFIHVVKFLNRSPFHAVVLAIWLVGFIPLIFRRNNNTQFVHGGLQLYAGLLFFFVAVYNQKLPFFLGPFLAPVIAQSFCFFAKLGQKIRPQYYQALLAVSVFAVIVTAGDWFLLNFKRNSNRFQREIISAFDAYTNANPGVSYYDIIGLLPRKNSIFIFVGPSEVAHKTELIDKVLHANPDMVVLTYKFIYLEPEFPIALQRGWVPLSRDVWGKGRMYSPVNAPKTFKNARTVNGKLYWTVPFGKETYTINNLAHEDITQDTVKLDDKFMPTQTNPVYLGVPAQYVSFVLSSVPPLHFQYPPSVLFRYDTSF